MTKLTRRLVSLILVCVLMSVMGIGVLAATDFDSKVLLTYLFVEGSVTQENNYNISTVTRVKVNPDDAHLWTACIQMNSTCIGTQLYDESEVGALSLASVFGILLVEDFIPTRVECLHAVQKGNGIAHYAETGIDLEGMTP